jgi:hypothetical protein
MLSCLKWLGFLTVIDAGVAQLTTLRGTGSAATLTGDNAIPTGTKVTYLSYSSTLILSSAKTLASGPGSASSLTQLMGGSTILSNSTVSRNATRTSSSATPTNTQPCNNYVELCTRKYSNITMITAHNFPFAKKANVESNQEYGVIDQLNDGVRMRKHSLVGLEM